MEYVLGLTPIIEPEVFRIGHRWHRMLDLRNRETPTDVILADLRAQYEADPTFNGAEWAILNYGFLAYEWHYTAANSGIVLHSERRFEIPFEETKIVGVFDRVERVQARNLVRDYKTSSYDIDADSDYWVSLRNSIQATMYIWAGVMLDLDIKAVQYDVYRKPGIRPKLLTQAQTKKFMTSGEYERIVFAVSEVAESGLYVENELADIKPGVKGDQIRETSAMFGARLLNSMYETPQKYFGLKEVTRTNDDLAHFTTKLRAIWVAMKGMIDNPDLLYHNEESCSMKQDSLCYHNRHKAVINGQTPDGWRRRFATLLETT